MGDGTVAVHIRVDARIGHSEEVVRPLIDDLGDDRIELVLRNPDTDETLLVVAEAIPE